MTHMTPAILNRDCHYKGGFIPEGTLVYVAQREVSTSLVRLKRTDTDEYLFSNDALSPARFFLITKPVGNEKTFTVMIAIDSLSIKRKVNGVTLSVTEIKEHHYNVLSKYIPNYFHQ